ncbi:Tetratricopeptide repeat-containing protein [Catalinimonas alkaloidigena]|uniref:Tetratricopeptide repeat-containing protein n=1 Tax=Catalinimonas alkaloidigena TaxID=1075417 RepID=A0A1G9EGE7_9BACT|nr:tetratricopeptide repeat protein [Catalinimonas alkaloidigena]SDK75184.1 Tetratricopeptide repeat-containing protein [Catalinimonas alkaloidigena]
MAKTKVAPQNRQQEAPVPASDKVLESPDALRGQLDRTEDFFRKNRAIVLGVALVVGLAIAGIAFWRYAQRQNEVEAQQYMFPAVYYYEADSLNKALNGDDINYGLLYIADEYGSTDAGNLAKFYIGSIYLKQGQYQQAIDALQDFQSDDLLLPARADALIGDAYMELENYAQAISAYKEAANYKPNDQFTPRYLMKLALAYEKNNQMGEAATTYARIINEYPQAAEVTEAKKYKELAELSQASN